MGLDYSQKRLISKAFSSKSERLHIYAFWMGLASTIISLIHLFLVAGQ